MQQYLNTRYFDCSFEYSISDNGIPSTVLGTPLYKFNFAERLGNALLTPVDWIDKKFNASSWEYSFDCCDCCRISYKPLLQAALVIIGIFAGIVGIIGLASKKIGESMNPHSKDRQAAQKVVQQIGKKSAEINGFEIKDEADVLHSVSNALLSMSSNLMDGMKVNTLFNSKILTEKLGATDLDICILQPSLFSAMRVHLAAMTMTEAQKKEQQARLDRLTPVCDKWQQFWLKLATPDAFKDPTLEDQLKEMVSSDQETSKAALEYFHKLRSTWQNNQEMVQLFKEYNRCVRPLRPDAQVLTKELSPDVRNLVLAYVGPLEQT